GKPVFDSDILSVNPTKATQFLPKRIDEYRHTGSSAIIQETYAEHFSCLLRADRTTKRNEESEKSKDNDFSLHVFPCSFTRHLSLAPFSFDPLIRSIQHRLRNRYPDLLRGL